MSTQLPRSTQLRRAVTSSYLGSVIEYYDFLLYGTASAVVFNKVFFANLDPVVATIASFGTFAAGHVARPIGGILFGHFGDLLGRKRMLVLSMTLMGVASFLIGVLPTYAQVGGLAPVGLVVLRVIQGIAVGGEWGGSVLMSAEHATSRRGLWAGFTNAGAPTGMVLSTAVMTGTSAVVGDEAFLDWGWRIPFLLSLLLLAVGLFVRVKVEETPVFKAAQGSPRRRVPVLEVLRDHPKKLLLGIGVGFAAFVAQSTLTTFVISYAVQAGHTRQSVLNVLTITSAGAVFGILAFSATSDRVGRRPIILAGAIAMAAWSFVLFPMIDARSAALLLLALFVGQAILHAMMYGPLAALYSEMFSTGNRYTGASLAYQIGGLGAGIAPLLFAQVQAVGGGTLSISCTVAAFCLIAAGCVLALKETSKQDLMPTPVAS